MRLLTIDEVTQLALPKPGLVTPSVLLRKSHRFLTDIVCAPHKPGERSDLSCDYARAALLTGGTNLRFCIVQGTMPDQILPELTELCDLFLALEGRDDQKAVMILLPDMTNLHHFMAVRSQASLRIFVDKYMILAVSVLPIGRPVGDQPPPYLFSLVLRHLVEPDEGFVNESAGPVREALLKAYARKFPKKT